MSIAKQTGKWSSKIKTAESKDPVFNFADISKFIDNTVEQNIAASLLVEALDVPHAVFRYEEFVPDPAPHIRRALGVLGISAPDLAIVEPTLARQANEVNAAFRDSYMEELMRRMAAAGQGAAAEGSFFQRVIRGRRRA